MNSRHVCHRPGSPRSEPYRAATNRSASPRSARSTRGCPLSSSAASMSTWTTRPIGHELLPGETGLLQPQPGADGDHQVGLLDEDVGGALPPGIRATGVQRVFGRNPVGPVPGGHDRNAGDCRPLAQGAYGSAAHPATDQDDRALRLAHPGQRPVRRRPRAPAAGRPPPGSATGSWPGQRRCRLRVQADFEEYRSLPGRTAVEHGVQDDVTVDRPLDSHRPLGDAAAPVPRRRFPGCHAGAPRHGSDRCS